MWSTRVFVLVALVGCDAVYGLNGRKEPDAALGSDSVVVDDADRPQCPDGPPVFTPTPVLILASCKDYTTSTPTNRALVMCTSIHESPLGSSGMTTPAIINTEANQTLDDPRLSPEGDEMFVTSRDTQTNAQSIRIYARVSGRWDHKSSPAALPSTAFASILFASTPTADSGARHLLVHHQGATVPTFTEFVETVDSWTAVRDYTAADFGMATFGFPSLTPDGLHLVFAGNPTAGAPSEIRYAHRSSIDDPFDTPVKIEVGVDPVLYPHLAPDCSRLYFTSLNQVLYVEP